MGLSSTTTLVSSEAPSFFEDQVTFSMTVTGGGPIPTGNIILSDTLDPTGGFGGPYTLPLDGTGFASIIINASKPGFHVLTAAYQGDGTYDPSSHQITQQVVDVLEPATALPGFSLVGIFSAQGDSALVPTAALSAIPASAPANTSLTLLWTVLNVPHIQITANTGTPFPGPSNQSPIIITGGSGIYVLGNGVGATTTFSLAALDASNNPIIVGGNPLVATATATVV